MATLNELVALMTENNKQTAEVSKRLDAVEKMAKTPASKAGFSPASLMGAASHPDALQLLQQGAPFMQLPNGSIYQPRPGSSTLTKTIKERGWAPSMPPKVEFGRFLELFKSWKIDSNCQNQKLRDELSELGMQKSWVDPNTGYIQKAALAESSGITGGYTVPPMFVETLYMLAIEQSMIEPRANKKPLVSRSLMLPALDVTTAYGVGRSPALGGIQATWEQEAGVLNESEPQFRQVELTAWLLGFISYASNTLLADNAVGLDSVLTELFSMAIAWYKDYFFLNGNGVGQPIGILNANATIQVTRNQTNHFNWLDVKQMLSKIYWPQTSIDKLIWVIHPSVLPDLLGMNDMSGSQVGNGFGRVLFQPIERGAQEAVGMGAKPVGKLLGADVFVSEKMAQLGTLNDVGLFACDQYYVGERLDLQIDVSPHVRFTQNQMTWRTLCRCDGQPALNQAITLADGSYQVSFASVLK